MLRASPSVQAAGSLLFSVLIISFIRPVECQMLARVLLSVFIYFDSIGRELVRPNLWQVFLYTFFALLGDLSYDHNILFHASNVLLGRPYLYSLFALASCKGLKIIVHIISHYFFTHPAPILAQPTLHTRDVTVIVSTIDPHNGEFAVCINSILANNPWRALIPCSDEETAATARIVTDKMRERKLKLL